MWKRQKEQEEKEKSEWLEEKKKRQSQITLETTISECYFGEYGTVTHKDMTIGALVNMNGDELLTLCGNRRSLFEEIVTVLASNSFFLADYSQDIPLEIYFNGVYERSGLKYSNEVLEITIEELDISVRAFNCLKRAGIETIGDIVNKSESEMIRDVRNLGSKALEEIKEKLSNFCISLKSDDE